MSGQPRLLPVAKLGCSTASSAMICPIPKLTVPDSIPVTRSQPQGPLRRRPAARGQAGKTSRHLGPIVKVPVVLQLREPSRGGLTWQLFASGREIPLLGDVQHVLALDRRSTDPWGADDGKFGERV